MGLRPLSYSIGVHIAVFGAFLFFISHESKEAPPKPFRINLCMCEQPSPAPKMSEPTVQHREKKEMPKPMSEKIMVPLATPQKSVSTFPSPPIASPVAQQQTIPVPAPAVRVETPKPVSAVIAVPAPAEKPKVNVEKEFLNAHLGEIRALLAQNMRYPKMAQKLRMQGEVRVAFSLDSDGKVSDIALIESSGFEILDSDAKALIQRVANQFPKPSKEVRISVPLGYVLH